MIQIEPKARHHIVILLVYHVTIEMNISHSSQPSTWCLCPPAFSIVSCGVCHDEFHLLNAQITHFMGKVLNHGDVTTAQE